MENCENCEKPHDKNYGSGRFCSSKCAKGFSTKAKRLDINKKVSEKLKGIDNHTGKSAHLIAIKKCVKCNKIFEVRWGSRYVANFCKEHERETSPATKEKLSNIMINKILNNEFHNFGKSIKCFYEFENFKINCDSKLEYVCLDYFTKNNIVKNITRCNFFINYIDFENINRKFVPDFIIDTKDNTYIVECKYEKLNYIMQQKWKSYVENSNIKKIVLEKYCKDNNYIPFWFTNKTDKNYKNFKLPDYYKL